MVHINRSRMQWQRLTMCAVMTTVKSVERSQRVVTSHCVERPQHPVTSHPDDAISFISATTSILTKKSLARQAYRFNFSIFYDTIRYDSVYLTCSKKLSDG